MTKQPPGPEQAWDNELYGSRSKSIPGTFEEAALGQ